MLEAVHVELKPKEMTPSSTNYRTNIISTNTDVANFEHISVTINSLNYSPQ